MRDKKRGDPIGNSVLENDADRVVLGLIALCLFAFAIHHIVAYDIWWQLKAGQLVRQSGFPTIDPFSYGYPGRVWTEVRRTRWSSRATHLWRADSYVLPCVGVRFRLAFAR